MRILRLVVLMALAVLALQHLGSCRRQAESNRLVILHAGSLAGPMRDLARLFEEQNPGVEVLREASGSRLAARKITQLGRQADVLAVADYLVIEDLMMPRFARWYLSFGRNRMVISFTQRSARATEINAENWFEILLAPEIRYGHSDPDLDPAGYRTLLLWQLAEAHYNVFGLYEGLEAGCPASHVRPGSMELLPLLESLDLDYVFGYESVARQHHLRYLPLPPEIDLGSPELATRYRQAGVEVSGSAPGRSLHVVGAPIVYAATIPRDAPNPTLAAAFIELLISSLGKEILERNFQTAIHPAQASDLRRLPATLQEALRATGGETG